MDLPPRGPTFVGFPALLSTPCLPQILSCCHLNSSQPLRPAQCDCPQAFGGPLKSPFPQAGHSRDLARMTQDTHCQPGPEVGAGSGQTEESASVAKGAVWGDLSEVLPPLPPPHRLHPFTDTGPGVDRGALCLLG